MPSETGSARLESISSDQAAASTGSASNNVTTDERTGLFGQFLDTLDGFYDQDRSAKERKPTESGKIVVLQQPRGMKADRVASSSPTDRTDAGRTSGTSATAHRSTRDKKSSNGGLLGSFFGSDRGEGDSRQPAMPRAASPVAAPPASRHATSSANSGQRPAASGNRRHAPSDGRSMAQQNRPQTSWMKRMLWPFNGSDAPATRSRTAKQPQSRTAKQPQTAARPRVSEPVAQTHSEPVRRVRERPVRVRPSLVPSVAIEFAQATDLSPTGPETNTQVAKSKVSEKYDRAPQPSPQSSVTVREPTLADVTPIADETHTIRVAARGPEIEEERTPTLAEEYAKSEIRVAVPPPDRTDHYPSPRNVAPIRTSDYASVQFESSVDALGLAQSMNDFQNGPSRKPSTGGRSSLPEVRMARQPGMVR